MTDDTRRALMSSESSDLSSPFTLVGSSPSSPQSPTKRPHYQRLGTSPELNRSIIPEEDEDIADTFAARRKSQGLGIATSASSGPQKHGRRVSLSRVPVGGKPYSKDSSSKDSPASVDFLLSPRLHSRNPSSGASTAYEFGGMQWGEEEPAANRYVRPHSTTPPYGGSLSPSNDMLKASGASIRSAKSTRSVYDNDFQPDDCATNKEFLHGSSNYLAVSILVLSIFSTVFSGIYVGIALNAPRYGEKIHSKGKLTAASASVLTQLFAKLIELSFATVFVTFLGQVLSRRAFSQKSNGVTLAQWCMRNWVMQPGSVITHYEAVRFAALTLLGMFSLTAALMAMLYTTAASALVAPALKFGKEIEKPLFGQVQASFADAQYIMELCQTPIPIFGEGTAPNSFANVKDGCTQIKFAGMTFSDYDEYLTIWADAGIFNATDDQKIRPLGASRFLPNTTARGQWIEIKDTVQLSKEFGRTVNNITMAMPHPGLYQASRNPQSKIIQPEELDGVGIYSVRAAVPSPFINVICANANHEDLEPLVYESQKNVTLNATLDLPNLFPARFDWDGFPSETPLDKVFGWTKDTRPIFYKFPINYNTLLNHTKMSAERPSIYVLGKGGKDDDTDYMVCQMKAGTTPNCATHFEATGIGGKLSAHCEDDGGDMTYLKKGNSSGVPTVSANWFWVAKLWLQATALNNGVSDQNASNARILTQLMLDSENGALKKELPSPAEALAVMGGNTLLMSAVNTPFVHFWNFSKPGFLPHPTTQVIPALVRAQEYASGGTQPHEKPFHIVLLAVFLTNLFLLFYFTCIERGLVTDFSEPPNLFAIAVNSPPSKRLAGACGGGPNARQYTLKWRIAKELNHLFMVEGDAAKMPGAPGDAHIGRGAWERLVGLVRGRRGRRGRRRGDSAGVEAFRGEGDGHGSTAALAPYASPHAGTYRVPPPPTGYAGSVEQEHELEEVERGSGPGPTEYDPGRGMGDGKSAASERVSESSVSKAFSMLSNRRSLL